MPQYIHTQVDIKASPDRVREAFLDFPSVNNWQTWLNVQSPNTATALQPGDSMAITLTPEGASGFKMQPKIISNTPEEFRWRGKLMNSDWLFVGEHYFQFQGLPDGQTRFVHGEDFKGCLVPLLKGTIDTAKVEFERFNKGLKQRLEDQK